MIIEKYFNRIKDITWQIEEEVSHEDIVLAFLSELGEIAQAIRIENKAPMVNHKNITESSRVEITDGIMILVEWFIRRGGTYEEINQIIETKMPKWVGIVQRFKDI